MPGIRVGAQGSGMGAALVPVPAAQGSGYQSWGPVIRTDEVPAPAPVAVPQDYSHQALHKSSQAPNSWRPVVYYQPGPASVFGGATDSDNQLPVPATPPNGRPFVAARRPVFLRQRQVSWPITLPNYSNFGG